MCRESLIPRINACIAEASLAPLLDSESETKGSPEGGIGSCREALAPIIDLSGDMWEEPEKEWDLADEVLVLFQNKSLCLQEAALPYDRRERKDHLVWQEASPTRERKKGENMGPRP